MGNKKRGEDKERVQDDAKGNTKEVGQVVLSVRNVYLRCLNSMHSKVAVLPESNDAKQQVGSGNGGGWSSSGWRSSSGRSRLLF